MRCVDVNGCKFLYELLALSGGRLKVEEVPLSFQARIAGDSKLDLAIVWDLGVSILHSLVLRSGPRGRSASPWWAPRGWWCSWPSTVC